MCWMRCGEWMDDEENGKGREGFERECERERALWNWGIVELGNAEVDVRKI